MDNLPFGEVDEAEQSDNDDEYNELNCFSKQTHPCVNDMQAQNKSEDNIRNQKCRKRKLVTLKTSKLKTFALLFFLLALSSFSVQVM